MERDMTTCGVSHRRGLVAGKLVRASNVFGEPSSAGVEHVCLFGMAGDFWESTAMQSVNLRFGYTELIRRLRLPPNLPGRVFSYGRTREAIPDIDISHAWQVSCFWWSSSRYQLTRCWRRV
jgi:hypothetical protein